MGYHSRATGHGFRATASTILNENGFSSDIIERQLAHMVVSFCKFIGLRQSRPDGTAKKVPRSRGGAQRAS
jgi:hypothetical protein